MRERRMNSANRERFEALRASLIARLRRVCQGMPQREFDRLTIAMTRLYLKYEPWTALPEEHMGSNDPLKA